MGDSAYNALPAAEKKHADIITIIAQANGKATLMLENLLSRAADTAENSWLDRFITADYDDLLDETGLAAGALISVLCLKGLKKRKENEKHPV